ncbi:MAG: hypothetical protein RRY64_07830, partial [Oscillospiraceae bacterium]
VEIGVTTLMSTFVAMLGLGKSGFLLCLPLVALVFNCAAFWALHHFLGGKLTELLHPLERVTKHMPLSSLLEQFRQGGAHFALV